MSKSVWLIGNRGMLGSEVQRLLFDAGIPCLATDLECDITDHGAVASFANGKTIDWIINCSAYTAVDRAEDEEEVARGINAEGVENVARVANEINGRMIHISTDYVFDGEKREPYTEDDPVAPLGAYGRTKAEGERLLAAAIDRFFIIRTAWLYGKNGNNFVYTMLRLMSERASIDVVSNQWGTPTFANDLAAFVVHLVTSNSEKYGIYNFSNEGRTNWYEFAREIYRQARRVGLLESECAINPIPTDRYPTKAHRPKNSLLSKAKAREQLGYKPRRWSEALEEFLKDLANEPQAH